MDTGTSNKTIGFTSGIVVLTILFIVLISGCGERCTEYLHIVGTVPDTTISKGQVFQYDLFGNVWQLDGECDAEYYDPVLPEVRIDNMNPGIVEARIDSTSILKVHGVKPGKAEIILFATGSYHGVADAVHFTVTVK